MNETGKQVQRFYNETPFPDYELDRFNAKEDLRTKAYPFAKALDRSIPVEAAVIDVGTGTGQLSAFLSLKRACVWGIDFSDSSLQKAILLKNKLRLDSLNLGKVDILDQKQVDNVGEKFDYVLCLGVLHHTGQPYLGFQNILRLLKPGGHIAIGLYNNPGRVPLKIRKLLLNYFKKNQKLGEKFIKIQIKNLEDRERARGWINDQYFHPHETMHTVGEVLKWFKNNNIEFLHTIPSTSNLSDRINFEIAGLFKKEPEPSLFKRFLAQLYWLLDDDPNGGYWITFGKLKN